MTSNTVQRSPLSFADPAILARTLALLAKGLLTELPGLRAIFPDTRRGADAQSASSCYGVWLQHLTLLWQHGMRSLPRTVVELGPAPSLGMGFAALLSGAERYVGVDAGRRIDPRAQLCMLEELIALFRARAPRPQAGAPDFDGGERRFPAHILSGAHLARALAPARLHELERAIAKLGLTAPGPIHYATWDEPAPLRDREVDLVFSHAVLAVMKNLDGVCQRIAQWLRPGGWMSAQIDFTSHGATPEWNGHLQYSPRIWKRVAGRRPFFAQQSRCSAYLERLQAHGLQTVWVMRGMRYDGLPRARLAAHWQALPEEDLCCHTAFVIARKREH